MYISYYNLILFQILRLTLILSKLILSNKKGNYTKSYISFMHSS